ncbi:hypothetical protein ACGVWS_07930 [Enterobacteriaceae bacterium LUAb1]
MQRVIFSMSRSLLKWLGCKLPPMPVPEGELKGRVQLRSSEQQVCWQCDLYQMPGRDSFVMAMESYSRFTLLIPFTNPVPLDVLLGELLSRWESHFVAMAVNTGVVDETQAQALFLGFRRQDFYLECFQNIDLSMKGHITDNFLTIGEYEEPEPGAISQDYIHFMEEVMNELPRRSKRDNTIIMSEERFLKDGLLRFGSDVVKADGLDNRIQNGFRELGKLRQLDKDCQSVIMENNTLH